MDDTERLRAAVEHALSMLKRVSGEGSVLEQMLQHDDWMQQVSPSGRADVADVLDAMAEQVRHGRAVVGRVTSGGEPHGYARGSLKETLDRLLPLNRKERYYTGTVLPMIVASDGFAHLYRLLNLCGLNIDPVEGNPLEGLHPVEFFTEYSFAESRFTAADRSRFPDAPTDADTPDVVIIGTDWLLAIEAKVFHNPLPQALNHQMERQKVLVDYWRKTLGFDADRVRHVLLLPQRLPVDGVTFPVVTWEQVLEAYRVVGPAYWTAMLANALERYEDLVSVEATFGRNAHGHLTGQQIVNAHAAGTLEYAFMGRGGGLNGPALGEDVATGRWRTQRYEVRRDPMPGKDNWFEIAAFIQATTQQ